MFEKIRQFVKKKKPARLNPGVREFVRKTVVPSLIEYSFILDFHGEQKFALEIRRAVNDYLRIEEEDYEIPPFSEN